MIVRMNKYAFMVYHKEYDEFLLRLRDLGVVHVKGNKSLLDNSFAQKILQRRKRIDDSLKVLNAINSKKEEVTLAEFKPATYEEVQITLDKLDNLTQQQNNLQNKLSTVEKDVDYMTNVWGDFSYSLLRKIKESGYAIHFFNCLSSDFKEEWEKQYTVIQVNTHQSSVYFIVVAPEGEPVKIAAERTKLPQQDLKSLTAEKEQLSTQLAGVEKELDNLAIEEYNTLLYVDKQLQDEFNLTHVRNQTSSELDNKLMLLEGWIPQEKSAELQQALDQGGFFYRKLEIEGNDIVPIKLKNNKFSRLYEPICKMFSLPNYREFDPTPFFAPFFMLFFGLCFADGGYGLLMVVVCGLLKSKVNPDYRPYLSLFQFLGGAALMVGILTGSFFGISLVTIPAFKAVKDYFLTSDNLMTISLVLGIIHILFGKSVAALKTMYQKGAKFGIAPFAVVFLIASLLLAFGLPYMDIHLSETLSNVLLGVAGVSLFIALFYNSPGKNIFLNFGSGIWNMYNVASGLLGDTLSYIRLFAIGLTGGILGGVFNSLAITMTDGMGIIPKVLFMTIILLFGHALNFGLCTISALVHPLRLIFVEYYKNAEFEGGGQSYNPFKKA